MSRFEEVDNSNVVVLDISKKQRDFYIHENHCCICGAELAIKMVKDKSSLMEEASCESCVTVNRRREAKVS